MKKIYLLASCLFTLVLFMSNKGGRATSQGQGSTGAPGEPQACKNCHNGNIVVDLKLYVIDGNDTIKSYEPGKSYTIEVVVNHLSGPVPKGYGFQVTGLIGKLNSTGTPITTFSANSANVKTAILNSGRQYAEHKGVSTTNTFRVNWTAPSAGLGPISFYTAGNGVNSNSNESGDGASKTAIQIEEKVPTSTKSILASDLKIYPNPSMGTFYLQGKSTEEIKSITIFNLLGKQINQWSYQQGMIMDLSDLSDGIYLAQFLDENRSILRTQKLIKRNERP